MKKLLWVGDAACPSGFARATHEILDVVRNEYEVTVLGINYRGDPHKYPYDIYSAYAEGDSIGFGRIIWMCDRVKPDVIVFQNDGWNLPLYTSLLHEKVDGEFRFPDYAKIPLVGVVAVDGKNFRKRWLDGFSYAIFWTEFGLNEARLAGYDGPAAVIPLGVDTNAFKPMKKVEARITRGLPTEFDNAFIVGNVNRNQPRKRWDLTIRYFANWIKDYHIPNAFLFLHCAPTGDPGIDVKQMAEYYGIESKVILVEPPPFHALPEEMIRYTYCCFDVQISTTGGEGFGFTTFEGMACGIPQIVTRWSSLEELVMDVAITVPCTSTALNPIMAPLNIIHGVPDERVFIEALNELYENKEYRESIGQKGLEFVQDDRFRWPNIGRRFTDAITEAVEGDRCEVCGSREPHVYAERNLAGIPPHSFKTGMDGTGRFPNSPSYNEVPNAV